MTHFLTTCSIVLGMFSATTAGSSLHGSSLLQGQTKRATGNDVHVVVEDATSKEKVHRHSLIAQTPKVDQTMTICNAYASQNKLEVVQVSNRKILTDNAPLAYKQCKEFTLALQEGEQFDFKSGGADVGTFFATGLPKSAANLLLIPHRKTPYAVGCSFESHAFANVQSPQIAVIDAYRGKSDKQPGAVKISETADPAGSQQAQAEELIEEDLRFKSVVAVNPGKYKISLTGTGMATTAAPLNAVGATKFVVMRVGIEDDSKSAPYPQELVVFPNAANRLGMSLITLVAVLIGLSLREVIYSK